jgi:hypothetical protein
MSKFDEIPVEMFRNQLVHKVALLSCIVFLEGEVIGGKVMTRRDCVAIYAKKRNLRLSSAEFEAMCMEAHRLIVKRNEY